MTPLLAIYAIVALILIFGTTFSRGKVRKILLFPCVAFVVLPLCFLALIGALKPQIQQGKLLPGLGPLLILVSPPEDLWVPLGSISLDPNIETYSFDIRHKYVGNHVVELSSTNLRPMENGISNLEVQYMVVRNGRVIFEQTSKNGWPYWGTEQSGFMFVSYNVPKKLPINENLIVTITIKGDISAFIEKYGAAKVTIKKGSDL